MTKATVIQHPTAAKAFGTAAKRWLKLRRAHAVTERLMWCGQMVSGFSDAELATLKRYGYLSESDCNLLRLAGRPVR